jgi:opacity protein-like surface antigen
MLRIFAFALFLFGSASEICASDSLRAKIKEGEMAMLFQFSGFGNLSAGGIGAVETPVDASNGTTVQITGVGFKYFTKEKLALRGSVTISRFQTSQAAIGSAVPESNDAQTALGVEAGFEYHLHDKRFSPYAGALAGYSQGSYSSTVSGNTSSATRSGYGVAAIAGGEFFLFEQVSLAAEYRLVYQTRSSTLTTNDQTSDGPRQTSIGVFSQGFLTLTLYLF